MASVSKSATKAARGFLEFVNSSPSPFHAVLEASKRLDQAGFMLLNEHDPWTNKILPKGKYYFTRNQSSIIAFVVGAAYMPHQNNGFAILAAHTDSPCLKLKPHSNQKKSDYQMVGVQTYGGGIWHSWFDRDLGVAGRVIVNHDRHLLVNIADPILRIPSLAIHLDRGNHTGSFSFNNETNLIPILAEAGLNGPGAHPSLLISRLKSDLKCSDDDTITDLELSLFDVQPAVIGGIENEYVFSARCDNLVMSYTSVSSIINAALHVDEFPHIALVCLFDHEEIGSKSAYGADSNFLETSLKRIMSGISDFSEDDYCRAMSRSFLISADMAHAVHPNYADKHEDSHKPRMNHGVVIKHNASQRYATTSATCALLRRVAQIAKCPLQEFVVRNDSACGSTIGPCLSSRLGIRTIDVGNPQLSMHSIREQAGVQDFDFAIDLFTCFFKKYTELDS